MQDGSSGEEAGRPGSLIDEIVREGSRRMLAEALQAEVDAYIARFAGERDEWGRHLVVRNLAAANWSGWVGGSGAVGGRFGDR